MRATNRQNTQNFSRKKKEIACVCVCVCRITSIGQLPPKKNPILLLFCGFSFSSLISLANEFIIFEKFVNFEPIENRGIFGWKPDDLARYRKKVRIKSRLIHLQVSDRQTEGLDAL